MIITALWNLNIYLSTLIPPLTNAANTADLGLYQMVGGQRAQRPTAWRSPAGDQGSD